jgi:hypothetical protein
MFVIPSPWTLDSLHVVVRRPAQHRWSATCQEAISDVQGSVQVSVHKLALINSCVDHLNICTILQDLPCHT